MVFGGCWPTIDTTMEAFASGQQWRQSWCLAVAGPQWMAVEVFVSGRQWGQSWWWVDANQHWMQPCNNFCRPAMGRPMVVGGCWATVEQPCGLVVAGQHWMQPWNHCCQHAMETAMHGCWATMEAAVVIGGCWSAMEVAAVTVHEQCKLNTCGQVWCLVVVQQQAGVRVVMEAAVEDTVSVFPIVSPSTCQGARCWR